MTTLGYKDFSTNAAREYATQNNHALDFALEAIREGKLTEAQNISAVMIANAHKAEKHSLAAGTNGADSAAKMARSNSRVIEAAVEKAQRKARAAAMWS